MGDLDYLDDLRRQSHTVELVCAPAATISVIRVPKDGTPGPEREGSTSML